MIIILFLFIIQIYSFESGSCGDACTFVFDEITGEFLIEGYGESYDYNTEEDRPWHSYKDKIKSIKITGSLLSIGTNVFKNCSNLVTVDLGISMKSIGEYVFRDCISLKSITLLEKLEIINSWSFLGCSSLSSVVILNDGIKLGDGVFWGCPQLTSVIYFGKTEPSFNSTIGCAVEYLGCGSTDSPLSCAPFNCTQSDLEYISVPYIYKGIEFSGMNIKKRTKAYVVFPYKFIQSS